MILIDKPYVSDLLIETIKKNNFLIVSTSQAKEMIADETLNWIPEEDAKNHLENKPRTKVYTNSENNINWLQNNAASSGLPPQIELFKNKIKFRELVKDSFPNYFFKGCQYNELHALDVENFKFPFIIKPSVGFFSIAVHKVDSPADWTRVLDEIEEEIERSKNLYPKEVINITEFILEAFIPGEEYAIDCYFDKEGKPVILNILHHIFSSDNDVSDRVYSTSKEIIEKYYDKIQKFLETIGKKAGLVNFPAHLEIRIDKSGEIIPIEVNPLRFGGWCTTGDLSWFAYEINSYEYFFNSKKPDWEEIFTTRKGKKYSLILLDNNSGIKEEDIKTFDYESLLNDFEKPLHLRKLELNKYSIFGFLFTETTIGNEKELSEILTSNLRQYIKLKNPVATK